MLLHLNIKDLAIIDSLNLDFGEGFTVLTGETGAGKSIIIGALNLILGERASSEDVRTGCDGALVEAVFDTAGCARVRDFLGASELGGEAELVIRREVNSQGRNRCFINGRLAPLAQLKQLGDLLADLHGQHQHQSLLKPESHREILDAYGDCEALLAEYRSLYVRHGQIMERLARLNRDERETERQKGILEFQIQEIRTAQLQPGEDAALEEELKRLQHADTLERNAVAANDLLYEGETQTPTAEDLLGKVEELLAASARLDPSLSVLADRLAGARAELEEIAAEMRQYAQSLQHDPARLAEVEERLRLIRLLKRKYGATIEEIMRAGERFADDLHALTHSREEQDLLEAESASVEIQLAHAAEVLSARRAAAGKRLAEEMRAQLRELEMPAVQIEVRLDRQRSGLNEAAFDEDEGGETGPLSVSSRGRYPADAQALGGAEGRWIPFPDGNRYRIHEQGVDQIEFLISPNAGEEIRPLRKIASGGELSRIMLAVKALMAGKDQIPILVFDEIDTGISGVTGARIGDKMARLGRAQQVICITHLAQIAARANHHFAVRKGQEKRRTLTRVEQLGARGRVEEIARLLGGDAQSPIALRHAEDLLESAAAEKAAGEKTAAGPTAKSSRR